MKRKPSLKCPSKKKARNLTDEGREKNMKLKGKIEKQGKALQELVDKTYQDGVREYIGPTILKQAQEAVLELAAAGASLDVILEDGWAGKVAEVEKDVRKKSENAREQHSRLLKQAEDAIGMTSSSSKGRV